MNHRCARRQASRGASAVRCLQGRPQRAGGLSVRFVGVAAEATAAAVVQVDTGEGGCVSDEFTGLGGGDPQFVVAAGGHRTPLDGDRVAAVQFGVDDVEHVLQVVLLPRFAELVQTDGEVGFVGRSGFGGRLVSAFDVGVGLVVEA